MPDLKTIMWFRQDLRLSDNPALHAAARAGAVIPVYIHSPLEEGVWAPGAASQWWLHYSLISLDEQLRALGSRLVLRSGSAAGVLAALLKETGAQSVHFSRRYEPAARAQEQQVVTKLEKLGATVHSFNGSLLREPTEILNKTGEPYKVYTAYARACRIIPGRQQLVPDVARLPAVALPKSAALQSFDLLPDRNWDAGIAAAWAVGEKAARTRTATFIADIMDGYSTTRNQPSVDGVSRLSPHLHFGELSARTLWNAVEDARARGARSGDERDGAEKYGGELLWREFAYYTLFYNPQTPQHCLRSDFETLPWIDDSDALRLWQRGQTGIPIVDAGMRELWTTGWMHNRVRMIVASFLVKDLLIKWQSGAQWFWDTLVDADLANNTLGWQWVAGCGVDAAPYFRIMNPTLQGTRFDPDGIYVRRWVPELATLPSRYIHQPWQAPPPVLSQAKVTLAENYPQPLIEHGAARQRVLSVFAQLRRPR